MSENLTNRRKFLETIGSAGAASLLVGSGMLGSARAAEKEKLALDGGSPVRTTRLHAPNTGPQFFDEAERKELMEVVE